jgi:small subunit ribosomal protein S1
MTSDSPERSDEQRPPSTMETAPETSPPGSTEGGAGLRSRVQQQVAQRSDSGTKPAPPTRPESRDEIGVDADDDTMARTVRPERKEERVPVPSRRDPLSDDLEQELAAALGGASFDQILAQETTSGRPAEQLELDTQRRAQVVRIHKDNVFFSLGGRNEGVASLRQFADAPNVGDERDVTIVGFSRDDGLYELTIPGASISVSDWADISEGALVDARISGANTGGLECLVGNIRGFIPASQVAVYRVENLSELIGEKMTCLVTEANPERGNLVLSRRSVLEREREEARQTLLSELEPGQTREGVVRSIREFGAFVDLGGVDGLIHISQLSWDRVENPREILEEGQRVSVRVEKIDPETGKISLSYRNLQEHPWETAPARFPVGSVVNGTVTRIAKFGAFVKLAPGVEGLIHISELGHQRVGQVSQVVKEGQELEVKVLTMDPENQRIALSLKALQAAPVAEAPEPEEEEVAPVARPKSNLPLKGGVDRPSGGDSFGLKW